MESKRKPQSYNPNRCKYCNEVKFKDSHEEKDCAMREFFEEAG
jgi:hypothetical protein